MFCVYQLRQKIIRFFEYFTLVITVFFPQVVNSVELNAVDFFLNATFDVSGLPESVNLEQPLNMNFLKIGTYFSNDGMVNNHQSILTQTVESQDIQQDIQDMFRLNMRFDEALSTVEIAFNSNKNQKHFFKQEEIAPSLVNKSFFIVKQPKQLNLPKPESFVIIFLGILAILFWSRRKRTQRRVMKYTMN